MSIQGQPLEVTVVGANRLKDTEWITRQDPYVVLNYAGTRFRSRTCTDGDRNPVFRERFIFELIDGCREINVEVWNSNTVFSDRFIGSGKILLGDVLRDGVDESSWTIRDRDGKFAGEVQLTMRYSKTAREGRANAGADRPPWAAAYAEPAYGTPDPYGCAGFYPPPPGNGVLHRNWTCPRGHGSPPPAHASHGYPSSSSPRHPRSFNTHPPPPPYGSPAHPCQDHAAGGGYCSYNPDHPPPRY